MDLTPVSAQGGSFGLAILEVVGLIALTGIFVASETSVELLRPRHIKHLRDENSRGAVRLQTLLDGQSRFSAACSLGSHLARLVLVFAVLWLAPLAMPAVSGWFGWEEGLGAVLGTGLFLMLPVGLVHVVFGELVPKSFAALHPHRTAGILYRFIVGASFLLAVPAAAIAGLAGLLTRLYGGKASFAMPNAAEEEILTLVESAEEAGEIESDERELLRSVFSFTDTVAREVMTPRVDIDGMPVRSDPTEVVKVIQETGHSRIPLYEDTDDQIVGIIHAKDLLLAMLGGKAPNLRSLMRPPLYVPENKNLHELISEMRSSRSQLAVVQDEFGGTAGIVTIEDIVEELVGDIVDEYDVEEPAVVETETGWIVDGKTHVDDVNDAIGSEFETEEFDSIGGLVFGLFGRQPQLGERIEHEDYAFTVVETDGRRVAKLLVEKLAPAAELEPLDNER
jgi:putative hemolysin